MLTWVLHDVYVHRNDKKPVLGTTSFFLSPQSANPQPNFYFLNPQPQVRNTQVRSDVSGFLRRVHTEAVNVYVTVQRSTVIWR